jgi:hypothetical protein
MHSKQQGSGLGHLWRGSTSIHSRPCAFRYMKKQAGKTAKRGELLVGTRLTTQDFPVKQKGRWAVAVGSSVLRAFRGHWSLRWLPKTWEVPAKACDRLGVTRFRDQGTEHGCLGFPNGRCSLSRSPVPRRLIQMGAPQPVVAPRGCDVTSLKDCYTVKGHPFDREVKHMDKRTVIGCPALRAWR